ncbi:MAG: hypothetical protein ABS75_26875 [Pelagibacterium sp. SCN 63-23]|nr:MAG: hypothetical protein ABS75_26875 [Pelagibacterium sp. SCN 63-23]
MNRRIALPLLGSALVSALFGCRETPRARLSEAEAMALYKTANAAPNVPRSVFHLGHSLVGRDIPVMIAQLAGNGHSFHSQLGWGTSLKNHWDGEIKGFAAENNHPAARPAKQALGSGRYDAVVFTEMVEIRDAIRYHQSAEYLYRWAQHARRGNPRIALYLYETWPEIDDKEGWLSRVAEDLSRYWEDDILIPAVRADGLPIYVIPGGQALAATVLAIAARGEVDGVSRLEDFFALTSSGSQDVIHLSDLGAYVVALTHYAVLYHANPTGGPRSLLLADGRAAKPPGPALARLIQETVWSVVTRYEKTGVRP